MPSVRVRFAPSPTGELHIGNARTALYDFLFARHNKGTFIVRLEDTDRERLVQGSAEHILEVLYRFNMSVDEGVMPGPDGTLTQKGEYGPYIQSQRLAIYGPFAKELEENGYAYACFCSSERLEQIRAQQTEQKQKTGYDRYCRDLDAAIVAAKKSAGESWVLRMRMPESGSISFTDMVRGDITFQYADVDDYVLIKSDTFPTYHFASVVDDHLMHISHVIRGEEWISSTPKHIALYKAFGWDVPQIAHMPLLLNPDKSKLSKRQGDVAAMDFLKKGYLPDALVNFIALLGWNPSGEQEIYSLDELIEKFDITKVNTSGAVFNYEKLDWLNHHYIKQLSDEAFVDHAIPFLEAKGLDTRDRAFLLRIARLEKERVTILSEAGEETGFLFAPIVYDPGLLVWKQSTKEQTKEMLGLLQSFLETISDTQWNHVALEQQIKGWIQEQGRGNGEVLWPLRIALSGKEKSPDPFSLAQVHGKQQSLALIQKAYASL